MANQTLAEFTEKLFVADADHTFIWDTVGAISKRVSRNSWLNSGTLTSDAPVTISQTWNQIGTAFTAFKVNATSTASAAGSLLLDLQVGSVSTVSFRKDGLLSVFNSGTSTLQAAFGNWTASGELRVALGCNAGGYFSLGTLGAADTYITRDAANTLALRNGGAAQTFNIYASYSDASNYSRLSLGPLDGGGKFYILATNAGTGIARGINIRAGASQDIFFGHGTTDIVKITPTGLSFVTDDSRDIGASGANRPKNLYLSGLAVVGSSLSVGGDLTVGDTKLLGWISGRSIMSSPADGYIRFTDSFQTNFNRLQFGGTSASFPALKRVGTDLQVVVANTTAAIGVAAADADLTFIEDRYRRKGTGTPEAAVTAPIGAVYHRTDGGAGTSFYVKESGTGNTGWVGK